jgi:hypothetical protein
MASKIRTGSRSGNRPRDPETATPAAETSREPESTGSSPEEPVAAESPVADPAVVGAAEAVPEPSSATAGDEAASVPPTEPAPETEAASEGSAVAAEVVAEAAPIDTGVTGAGEPIAGISTSETVVAETTASETAAETVVPDVAADPQSSPEPEAAAPVPEEPAPEPAPAVAVPPRGPGFGRLVAVATLSTVLGAAIGIGGSRFLAAGDADAVRSAVRADLARSDAKIAELEGRLAALPKATAEIAAVEKRTAALEASKGAVEDLAGRLVGLEGKVETEAEKARASIAGALAAVPVDGSTQAALAAMAQRLDAALTLAQGRSDAFVADAKAFADRLRAEIDKRGAETAELLGGFRSRLGALESLRGEVDAVIGRLSGLETAAKETDAARTAAVAESARQAASIEAKFTGLDGRLGRVEAGAATADRARAGAVLAVALADLKSAVDAGRPFVGEFQVVRRVGKPDLAVLEPFATTGVASVSVLRERLAKVTRVIAEAEESRVAGDGVVERFVAHAQQIVRIRPAGAVVGEGVDAKLSRLEARMATGDLAGALGEWNGLPEAARRPVADWGAALAARVAVDAALARETAAVLSELSKTEAQR